MSIYEINPLEDPRWLPFLEEQPGATVFHSPGWLEALKVTYGYEPVVLTTSEKNQPLKNGLVLCKIASWLTGSRLVSLPFSDHCQPLVDDAPDFREILEFLKEKIDGKHFKYTELRPLHELGASEESNSQLTKGDSFYLHLLDLRPSPDLLFKNFHKSCVQRKLQRATREELRIQEGRTEILLKDFYKLMITTRRRHKLPPQPIEWFRNLCHCLGDKAVIRVAYKDGVPVASIFTISFKKTIVYKYGCSDAAFNKLGGTLALFWRTMQEAKEQGIEQFDLGRSEIDNQGLVEFKDHWGAPRSTLQYYRYPSRPTLNSLSNEENWKREIAGRVFARLPDSLLTLAGKLLYKHLG